MRKKIYFAIILLLVFFIRPIPAQGGYHVIAGEVFYYDVHLAEVDITLGGTRYVGDGYSLGGNHLDQGTLVRLYVDSVSGTQVDYTLLGSSYSQTYVSIWSGLEEYSLPALTINWLWKAQTYLSFPTNIPSGLGLIFHPFVDYALAFDQFEEIVAQTYSPITIVTTDDTQPTFKCVSEEKDGLYIFESFYSGGEVISGGNPEYDLDFSVRLKFVYDRNLAILQGMHYLAKGSGIYNGQKAKYRCESLIEMQYYDLPNFGLNGFDMQYDWWILPTAIGGGLLLIGTVVFVSLRARKGTKKKKKPKKKSTKRKKKK